MNEEVEDKSNYGFKDGKFQDLTPKENKIIRKISKINKEVKIPNIKTKNPIPREVYSSPLFQKLATTFLVVFLPYLIGAIFLISILYFYVGTSLVDFITIHKNQSSIALWTFGYFIISLLGGGWVISRLLSLVANRSRR